MKFEKLTDSKIKIIFSLQDMILNNISLKNLIPNSPMLDNLLQTILNLAKEKVDFEVGDSKLLIEAVTTPKDEYIFTITKLSENFLTLEKNNIFICKFNTFDNFIDLCSFLNNFSDLNLKEFSENFSLIQYNNTYYLYNSNTQQYNILLDCIKYIFSEFGTIMSDCFSLEGILNEYGKVIFSNNAIIKCIYSFV